jgi:hypothetical protein
MNPIQKLATSFIQEHWDEIDKNIFEDNNDKQTILDLIRDDESMAGWIVGEVMSWGTKTDYLKPYIVVDADIWVIKVEDKYFKSDGNYSDKLIETFPKEKTVIYFE